MSVILYTWGGIALVDQSGFVGHAALEAGNQYLSFHPREFSYSKLMASNNFDCRFSNDLQEDIEEPPSGYGRNYLRTNVYNVDEYLVETYIANIKSEKPKYNIYRKNCSVVVLDAISHGIDEENGNRFASLIVRFYDNLFPAPVAKSSTVDSLSAHLKNLAGLSQSFRNPVARTAIAALGAVLAAKNQLIISPADVVNKVKTTNNF